MSFELAIQLISLFATLWGVYVARLALKKKYRSIHGWIEKKSTVLGMPNEPFKKGLSCQHLLTAHDVKKRATFLRHAQKSLRRSFRVSKKDHEVHATCTRKVNAMFTNPPFQKNSKALAALIKKTYFDTPCIALFKKSHLVKLCFSGFQKEPLGIGLPIKKADAIPYPV